jgi:hypothetical protein
MGVPSSNGRLCRIPAIFENVPTLGLVNGWRGWPLANELHSRDCEARHMELTNPRDGDDVRGVPGREPRS